MKQYLNNHPVVKRFLKGLAATSMSVGLVHALLAFTVSALPSLGLPDLSVALGAALLLALEKSLPSNL